MKTLTWIAQHEARLVWRRLSTRVLWGLFTLFLVAAALLSHQRQTSERRQQRHYQELVRREWMEQPDRHPHRVAHYGNFAFKPRSPLASFDPGVEAQVGRVHYLEAHRQNAMNFAEAGGLTAAGKLGELSPAFVAGPLLALVIAVIGHGTIVEDRELGRLRVLLAQGAGRQALWCGKTGGLTLAITPFALMVPVAQVAATLLWPEQSGLMDSLLGSDALLLRGGLLLLAMLLHALLWVLVTVLVSSLAATRAQSAATLLCIWLCTCLVLPRAGAGLASAWCPLPARSEFNARIASAVEKLGDSHNPDDPAYVTFREGILRQYGAASLDELPVNYKGILMAKGEEHTSQVFEAELSRVESVMDRQDALISAVAWLSPLLSWQDISMRLCGTDVNAARRFARQAEAWRYGFVQKLNALQRDHIRYSQNGTQRLDRSHWHEFEDFRPAAPSLAEVLRGSWPAWFRLGLACALIASAVGLIEARRRTA
jgi:ABC-2 type transport system permease protein